MINIVFFRILILSGILLAN